MNNDIEQIQNLNGRLLRQQYNKIFTAFQNWKRTINEQDRWYDTVKKDDLVHFDEMQIIAPVLTPYHSQDGDEQSAPSFNPDHSIELERILEQIDSAIDDYDYGGLKFLFQDAEMHCNFLNIELHLNYDILDEVGNLAKVEDARLIYVCQSPTLLIPQLIIPVQYNLVSLIKDRPEFIFDITPGQFEELIAELFYNRGFKVELTRATRDGGRDIIAIYETMNVRTKYLIECKRYAPNHKISVSIVQRLYGIKIAEAANKAILATTSSFTKDAREFASNHIWDLELKAYDDIMKWIRTYNYMRKTC